MLVLARKVGQRILIGDNIWVTIVEGQGVIRLGIEAPDDVEVLREELLTQDQQDLREQQS